MKRIVIDARESGTSTGRYIDKLIQYLSKQNSNHEFIVLTKSHRVNFIKELASGFKVVECNVKEFTFAEQLSLFKQINSLKPDLVHFGMTQQPILYKKPKVTTVHDLTTLRFGNPAKNPVVYKIKQLVYSFVIKSAAKNSKIIITPSNYVKKDLVDYSGVEEKKITVTYEAADPIEENAKAIKALIGKKFLLYVGRTTPHKNLKRLISAFEKETNDNPDLLLVLAGKIDQNLKMIVEGLSKEIKDKVYLTDFVGDDELKWLYQNCQAYVFPSLSEGFGLPGLEAMVHGAPVISSNASCLPEIYGDGALYFDPLDINDIADKIKEVLDKTTRQNLIKNGYIQVKKYSWEKMAKETLAVYNKVLETKD